MDQRHRMGGGRDPECREGVFLKEQGGGEGRKEVEAPPMTFITPWKCKRKVPHGSLCR